MEEKLILLARSFGEEKVKFNESMRYHLATKTGGTARLFAVVLNERELIKIIEQINELGLQFLIIGTGSKITITDSGFEGVVVKNRSANIKILSIKGKVGKGNIGVEYVLLEAGSGIELAKFLEYLKKQGLEYDIFEDLRGSIGGNIFISRAMQDKCESVRVLNKDSDIETIPVYELNLRTHVVLSVIFKLRAKG